MSTVGSILSNLAARFSTQEQIDKLKAFYATNAVSFGDLQTIPNAITDAQFNVDWAAKHVPDIMGYLNAGSATITISLLLVFSSFLTYLW